MSNDDYDEKFLCKDDCSGCGTPAVCLHYQYKKQKAEIEKLKNQLADMTMNRDKVEQAYKKLQASVLDDLVDAVRRGK